MQRIARHRMAFVLFQGFWLISCGRTDTDTSDPSVIYGTDNRQEVYTSQSTILRERALSTVALVRRSDIQRFGSTINLPNSSYGSQQNLCQSERFFTQPNPAFCSGFLIAPDMIATAGHCVSTQASCDTTAFVFGMGYFNQADNPTTLPASDIYTCQQLIHSQAPDTGADFAVIKLDRTVVGRTPLAFRRSGKAAVGDPVAVIGHPSGLPTKITDGANVRDNTSDDFFVADTDTYSGNSGSAVFNASTGLLEGILVRGEQDFEFRGGCYVSKVCAQGACRGEDITLANKLSEYVTTTPPPPLDDDDESDIEQSQAFTFSSLNVAIPDNNAVGIFHNIDVPQSGILKDIAISIDVSHTYIGDLIVTFINPSGQSVSLHNRTGGSSDNIVRSWGISGNSLTTLDIFKNRSITGRWQLKIADRARVDVGKLNKVELRLKYLE